MCDLLPEPPRFRYAQIALEVSRQILRKGRSASTIHLRAPGAARHGGGAGALQWAQVKVTPRAFTWGSRSNEAGNRRNAFGHTLRTAAVDIGRLTAGVQREISRICNPAPPDTLQMCVF